ncbi:Methyl-accepting chemotaxis protein 4 [Vibrio aerogenes CECT 7868]|uniref:Methyl-accepting chemotaxis protein 4 n=1 Tax=Vibrio aerogenes CECT 7868 TaxID=1216006 RepID=A0A1M6A0K8_9VIBR|nr:methyl-accepting chemotaxis protein [Vibrio aerogenes]SHI29693.1 Methyl-accepting chemotaxis protein 4 [Vibrio aerogenes CECT 7868]
MKLSRQLAYLIVSIALGFVLLGLFGLESLRSNLIESRKHEIQSVLSFAKNQVSVYVKQEKQGLITREEAEKKAVEVLSGLRFGASYIWSNDNHAIARVHVRSEKLGQFQKSYQGHIAELRNKDFIIDVGENVKPGTNKKTVKINGVTKIPGWDWVIGYGVYMDDLDATYWSFAYKFIAISVGIVLVVISIVLLIARSILKRLGGEPVYAVEVTNRIAKGDLSEHIEGKFDDESLLGSIVIMQNSLKKMVKSILDGSHHLSNATSDLKQQVSNITRASNGSSDASLSTAASIQEMSICIGEISGSAEKTELNSEKAFEYCASGEELVKHSGEIINEISSQIKKSMEDFNKLSERSNEIGNVVNVIRDIAEQTNLLALNAAIEAARAGEQGRGFAVVADEVRTLASRTEAATSEITETIHIIQKDTDIVAKALQSVLPKVEESVDSSHQVNQMLGDIRTSSSETLDMVREVSVATSEQNKASAELTSHVEMISNMVKETAESIGQCHHTVSELDDLAKELHESISYFNLH